LADAGSDRTVTCAVPIVSLDGTGSSNNVSYVWSPSSNIIGLNTNSIVQTSTPGIYTLVVSNLNNGCTSSDQVNVFNAPNLPLVQTFSTPVSCYGGEDGGVSASITGGVLPIQYQWNTPNADTTLQVDSLQAGIYTITVRDGNSCVIPMQIEVTQPDSIEYEIRMDSISCYGESDGLIAILNTVGGTAPYTYSFDNKEYSITRILDNVSPGAHTYSIRDAHSCEQYGTVNMYEPNEIFVYAGEDVTIDLGDSTRLQAQVFVETDTFGVRWYQNVQISCDSCLSPMASPLQSTLYEIYLTDGNGCKATDQVMVNVSTNRPVYIPNAFTPNGDGINDWITVYGNSKYVKKVKLFEIYDRWGERVYQGKDISPSDEESGWNGVFRGKAMNPQVFVYHAEVEFIDGKVEKYKGDLTLIR
jgi:gliding motility-associated-like protein